MRDALKHTAQAWLAAGERAVVIEVAATRGSVPREAGTRMLVAADRVAGTIGGGHLEWRAIADARALIAADGRDMLEQHIALGPTLGQCCGGTVDLLFQRLQPQHLEQWPDAHVLFALQLYGAGHVGRAVVELLAGLPCRVQWIDERDDAFPPLVAEPSHIERLCVEPVQAEVREAAPGAFYLVLTHSHDLDMAISEAILKRGDFGFFGLIGSRTKRARFERRLLQRGITSDTLAQMTCPIGIPGIKGKAPEVLAVAVVAQLLQVASSRASAGGAVAG